MINLFVSMANNCKIILEMKVNQIMSYFLVFSLPMPLLPFKKKNLLQHIIFFNGNRPAVVIGKQNNKYRKINTALISKKKKILIKTPQDLPSWWLPSLQEYPFLLTYTQYRDLGKVKKRQREYLQLKSSIILL